MWDSGETCVAHSTFLCRSRLALHHPSFVLCSDRVSGEDPHSARAPPLQNVGVVGQVVLLLLCITTLTRWAAPKKSNRDAKAVEGH